MKKHTKIYMEVMGYDTSDFVPCEICGAEAVDIHHIEPRGMGGSRDADRIDNLMALCRECHNKCEARIISRDRQHIIHGQHIK